MDMTKDQPQDATPRTVRITTLGGDTKETSLTESGPLGSFLDRAGVTVGEGQNIQLNGRDATRDTVIDAGDNRQHVIVIASRPTPG